jgi:hypothetical protein
MAVPQTTEVELTHDLPILLLGMYPKKLKWVRQRSIGTCMFIESLLTIADVESI